MTKIEIVSALLMACSLFSAGLLAGAYFFPITVYKPQFFENSVVIEDVRVKDCIDRDGIFTAYQFMGDPTYAKCEVPGKTITY